MSSLSGGGVSGPREPHPPGDPRRCAHGLDRPGARSGHRSQGVPLRGASRIVPLCLARSRGFPVGLLPRACLSHVTHALLPRKIGFRQRGSPAFDSRNRPLPTIPGVGAERAGCTRGAARRQDGHRRVSGQAPTGGQRRASVRDRGPHVCAAAARQWRFALAERARASCASRSSARRAGALASRTQALNGRVTRPFRVISHAGPRRGTMSPVWRGHRVSVIFPAYNEEAGIAQAVADFGELEAVDEIVVVDNNSRDATAVRAQAAGARVVRESRQGYGHALRRGLAEAQGEYVVLAEPDGTFMGKDVLKLLSYADDFDLVLGTRTTRELIWHGANMGWQLRWGNWVVAKLLQVTFGGPSLSDCGCTLRLIRRSAVERLLPRFTVLGSHFLPEMVCLALLDGLRLVEVPVNYRDRVGQSKITGSPMRALAVGAQMLVLILRYRLVGR